MTIKTQLKQYQIGHSSFTKPNNHNWKIKSCKLCKYYNNKDRQENKKTIKIFNQNIKVKNRAVEVITSNVMNN